MGLSKTLIVKLVWFSREPYSQGWIQDYVKEDVGDSQKGDKRTPKELEASRGCRGGAYRLGNF